MKRLTVLVLLLATSLAGCARAPASLPQISPEEAGLSWRECPRTADWAALEACFGHTLPVPDEADTAKRGIDTEHGHRLEISADVYETREASGVFWNTYTLYKNGHAIASLQGVRDSFDDRSPDLSLVDIAGKAAWALYDRVRDQATIVYDGQDVRALYGLDRAIAPYEIDGKLIFLGSRAGRSFLVYDGRQVGPDSACVHLSGLLLRGRAVQSALWRGALPVLVWPGRRSSLRGNGGWGAHRTARRR